MGYKVYIRKDCRPLVWGEPDIPPRQGIHSFAVRVAHLFLIVVLAACCLLYISKHSLFLSISSSNHDTTLDNETAAVGSPYKRPFISGNTKNEAVSAGEAWETVTVLAGDNLSLIFAREKLSARSLDLIMGSGPEAALLARLRPGQEIQYQVVDERLDALRFAPSHWETLEVRRAGESFQSNLVKVDVETRVQKASGVIIDSLFISGQLAGLTDPLIMELVSIYAWDVDFALEVREGDTFKVLYEEYFRDGRRAGAGPILAAEFVNQGKRYRSVRYTSVAGHSDYYSDDGLAMRKAFLRTPLNFTRISSTFSLGRRHPILNSIRAHRGVDYAAPQGTPIKAAGDGTVVHVGSKGGYGRTVVLRHGGKYSTLYAHLSRYAGGLRPGDRVQQGRIIGYVGMSGLATGPHLHYEFQVAGVHRNPLTVDLPKAEPIAANQWLRFQQQTAPLLAELGVTAPAPDNIVVMRETGTDEQVVH